MIRRSAAIWLARLLVRLAAARDREWARGMDAELAHIEGDGEKLAFAAGGLWAVCRRLLDDTGGLLKLGRLGLAAFLVLFGLVVLRLILLPETSGAGWLTPPLVLAGAGLTACFAGAAWCLNSNRPTRFAGFLGGAFAVNLVCASALIFAGAPSPELTRWYTALLVEEFALIFGTLAAGLFLLRADALLARERAR